MPLAKVHEHCHVEVRVRPYEVLYLRPPRVLETVVFVAMSLVYPSKPGKTITNRPAHSAQTQLLTNQHGTFKPSPSYLCRQGVAWPLVLRQLDGPDGDAQNLAVVREALPHC